MKFQKIYQAKNKVKILFSLVEIIIFLQTKSENKTSLLFIFVKNFKNIKYSFCLDANKRNSDLDVNNGFSEAQGRLFKILKTLIFSSTNPLENCIINFCRKVSYSSFFLS
jgi:hypothetical protein